MTEDAIASTQYGDLKGTISLDGHDGLAVYQLITRSTVPKGYYPIGLRLSGPNSDSSSFGLRAKVLCVDVEQTGCTADDIQKSGQQNGAIHTFEFDAEVSAESVWKAIKRLDVVLLPKFTRDIDVKIQSTQH